MFTHETRTNSERMILIVDDERINLNLLTLMLEPEGYQIVQAESGEEALQILFDSPPDLVIMDVCMPGKNGFEVCQEIKSTITNRFIPVMLLTNLADAENQVAGLDAGADEYLVKPPRKAELLARIRALLRIQDLQEHLIRSTQDLKKANERLRQIQKQIDRDMERAELIQRSFLPSQFPGHPEIEFGHYYEPCAKAGGDYFNVVEMDDSQWGLLIADVTGHGTSAAIIMAVTHTLMNTVLKSFPNPSVALKTANEQLSALLSPSIFVTMFYGALNLVTMKFVYSSAGHEPMMLYRAREDRVEYLKTSHGFPLKWEEANEYDEKETFFEPEDKIILFTDGLVEILNENGEIFTPEHLEGVVKKYHALAPQSFVDAIVTEAKQFNGGRPFVDDVAILTVQRIT